MANTDRKLNKRLFWWTAAAAAVATYALTAWGLANSGGEDVLTATEVAQQTAMYGTGIAFVLTLLIAGVMIPRPESDRSTRLFCEGSDVLDEIREDRRHRQSSNFGMWGSDNDLPPMSMDGF